MLRCCPATVQGGVERRKKKILNKLQGMYGDAAVAMCWCRASGSTCMHEGTACCAVVLQQFRAEQKEEKILNWVCYKACGRFFHMLERRVV